MAKETEPKTYRVSAEVDAALRDLAKIHGGVDKALRHMLSAGGVFEAGDKVGVVESTTRRVPVGTKTEISSHSPAFRAPLLKPSERKR